MTAKTPEDLFRHGLDLLLEKDIEGWIDLWDEHGVVEFPFAPEGYPHRLEGKAAVAGYMRPYPDHIDLREVAELEIHRTADPETIVAEWTGTGRVVATGEPYTMRYVVVFSTRDGRIVRFRDYWNPLLIPASMQG